VPHVPSNLANLGPKNESAVQIRNNSGVVQGPQAGEAADSMFKSPEMGGEKLSLVRFEVAPERIFEQLFGKGQQVDEHTGITTMPRK